MRWTDLARRQHGLIARHQLVAFDMSQDVVTRMAATGRLEATCTRGVFRVAGAPFTPESAAWLAVLHARCPLSHMTAAELWDLDVVPDGLIHLTRIDRQRIEWPPGVRVHRVALRAADITERHGLAVTTRTETVLDCLGYLPLWQARTFADRAVQQGWITSEDLLRRLRDRPKRWGNGQLRRLLPQIGDGAAAESERRLHRLLRQHGITGWKPNHWVQALGRRYQVDVAFPEQRLVIEIDGFDYHRRDRFQGDRTRQNALVRAGWTVLRFTWADIVDRPDYVLATIGAELAN